MSISGIPTSAGKSFYYQEFTTTPTLNASTAWTSASLNNSASVRDAIYAGSQFVTVGRNGAGTADQIQSSSTGATSSWTAGSGTTSNIGPTSVAYSPSLNLYVALGSDQSGATSLLYTSTSGTSWTSRNVLPSSTNWYKVIWHNDRFIAISGGGSATLQATAYSTTGTSAWTAGGNLPSAAHWSALASDGTTCVVVAGGTDGGTVLAGTSAATTTDATSWTARTLPQSLGWASVAYDPLSARFVAVANGSSGSTSNVAYSGDSGATWNTVTTPSTANWPCVIFADDRIVMAQGVASTQTNVSYDCINYVTGGTSVSIPVMHLAYGNGKLLGFTTSLTGTYNIMTNTSSTSTFTGVSGVSNYMLFGVAAGGGGGTCGSNTSGGAGGGGQVVYKPITLTSGTTYVIQPGVGGVAGAVNGNSGSNGQNTEIGTYTQTTPLYTLTGGGGGGAASNAGKAGGCGGGAGSGAAGAGGGGGGMGGPGGLSKNLASATTLSAGVLGGIGSAGSNGGGSVSTSAGGGDGGVGLYGYGGGGGGGTTSSVSGTGGAGSCGGGTGGIAAGNGGNALANSGSGGGGAGQGTTSTAGNGGSGYMRLEWWA